MGSMRHLVFCSLGSLRLVQALRSAVTCTTTADCAWGETCVAGDSDSVVQACVPSTVCGGSSAGNCPSDASGKLACLWRPVDDCKEGCAMLDGNKGVYKCVSLARCDKYYGGTACSNGCNVNGMQCNGQGPCAMVSSNPDGTPRFSCTCGDGYSGDKCEIVSTSTARTKDLSFTAIADKRLMGDDNYHSDARTNFISDDVTDRADKFPTDPSTRGSMKTSSRPVGDLADTSSSETSNDSPLSTVDQDMDESTGLSDSNDVSSNMSPPAAPSSEPRVGAHGSGIRSGVLILVLVMAIVFVLGAVILAVHLCKKKRQEHEEEDAYAFERASSTSLPEVERRVDLTSRSRIVLV